MSEPSPETASRTARAFKVGEKFARLKAQRKALMDRLKAAEDQLAEMGKAPMPEDVLAENGRLKAELTAAKHRDAFGQVLGDKSLGLHGSVTADSLQKILGYKAEGDPDPAKIKAAIEGLKASDPYLFGASEPAPRPPGAGQGDRGATGGGAAITRAQIKDPKWILVPENAKAASLALKEGRVVD